MTMEMTCRTCGEPFTPTGPDIIAGPDTYWYCPPCRREQLGGICRRCLVKGDLEPQIATATANLARTMIAVRESVEIETRLDALEKAVEGQRMTNGRFTA